MIDLTTIAKLSQEKGVKSEIVETFLLDIYKYPCEVISCIKIIEKVLNEDLNRETALTLVKGSRIAFEGVKVDCSNCDEHNFILTTKEIPISIYRKIDEDANFEDLLKEMFELMKQKKKKRIIPESELED
jgi:hypothetical protein